MTQGKSSGIDVLIVGGGIGGLFCAVEMYRHGHEVRILESKEDVDTIGLLDHRACCGLMSGSDIG